MLAAFARSCEIKVHTRGQCNGGSAEEVSEKTNQKKPDDQRPPVTIY